VGLWLNTASKACKQSRIVSPKACPTRYYSTFRFLAFSSCFFGSAALLRDGTKLSRQITVSDLLTAAKRCTATTGLSALRFIPAKPALTVVPGRGVCHVNRSLFSSPYLINSDRLVVSRITFTNSGATS
jgi:hypothetical protein